MLKHPGLYKLILSLVGIFGIFISVFLIYILGVSHSVYGADSGDVILASWFGGIAHPPGYPLNTMIGWVFTHLPYHATVAFKAGVMSAFLQALSIGLIFLIIDKLVKNKIIALAASLTLAFSPIYFLYAHVAEVFQLLNVLVLASLYFLIVWISELRELKSKNRNQYKNVFISLFFLGLSFFHHHTAILLLPAWFFLIYITDKKFFTTRKSALKMFLSFSLGLLPYLFVFTAVFRNIPIKWDNPTSLSNFINLITRGDYGTFVANSQLVGASLAARMINVLWYFKVVKADFTWVGIAFLIMGLFYLFRNKPNFFWFFALAIFFTGPFFMMYASFPPFDNFILGILERFFMLSFLFWAIVLAYGLYGLLVLAQGFMKRKKFGMLVSLILTLTFLLLPFSFLLINGVKTDLSNFKLGRILPEDLLSEADPAGIVFLAGDTIVFNTQYSYYADKTNANSTVINGGSLTYLYYREILKKEFSQLQYPNNFLTKDKLLNGNVSNSLIELNFDKYPIYTNDYASLAPEGYVWVNEGILSRLYKKDNLPTNDQVVAKLEKNLAKMQFNKDILKGSYLQFIPAHLKDIYIDYFIHLGKFLLSRNLDDEAGKFFNLAIGVKDDDSAALNALGDLNFKNKRCVVAEDFYKKAIGASTISGKHSGYIRLGNLYRDCFEDSERAKQYFDAAEKLPDGGDTFKSF